MLDKKRLEADSKNPLYASSVRVQVLNGTPVQGLARTVAEKLRESGVTVTGSGNAPEDTGTTKVTYPAGLEKQADALAARLPGVRAKQASDAAADLVSQIVGMDLAPNDIR